VFDLGTGAVPVWFVSWRELEAALIDDKLTIGELRSMQSLQIGHAIRFEGTSLLSPQAQLVKIRMTASGDLLDGRQFEFQYAFSNGRVTDILIKLENPEPK
jgi:hypothetical protein